MRCRALDLKIPAEAQTALYQEISTVLRRQTFWLAKRAAREGATVDGLIAAYRPAADALRAAGGSVLSRFEEARLEDRVQSFIGLGASDAMARDFAMLRPLVATADIGDLAREAGWPEPAMAMLYHQVGAAFDFDRLRAAAGNVPSADHFDRLAVRRLIEDLMAEQMTLTRAVAKASNVSVGASEAAAEKAVDDWVGPASGRRRGRPRLRRRDRGLGLRLDLRQADHRQLGHPGDRVVGGMSEGVIGGWWLERARPL
jgi:glutamate dehydrogenase